MECPIGIGLPPIDAKRYTASEFKGRRGTWKNISRISDSVLHFVQQTTKIRLSIS